MSELKEMTICDDCPCMNNDYEQGTECNLDYDCDLFWTLEGELHNASPDCELQYIRHGHGKIFYKPETKMLQRKDPR